MRKRTAGTNRYYAENTVRIRLRNNKPINGLLVGLLFLYSTLSLLKIDHC